MRSLSYAAALLLFLALAQSAGGEEFAKPGIQPVRPMPASFAEVRRPLGASQSQIADCANLAAIRALDAKAHGAGYAVQDRILDLTFVLCMAGTAASG